MQPNDILERYAPQIGEILQHELNADSAIARNSDRNYVEIARVVDGLADLLDNPSPRILEIASYRHFIGYRFADRGFRATQFDLSDRDLRAARDAALALGLPDTVTLVAGDFHDLPFADGFFDFVFVSAAIHHTSRPKTVVEEAMRVLRNGGYFYCLREPSKRSFSFARFRGNRAPEYTDFEKALVERGLQPLLSSPFYGTRNAVLFSRVENDNILIDDWVSMLQSHGTIERYEFDFENLLTSLDRDVLAHRELGETELARYIGDRIRHELDAVAGELTQRDELLGISLPSRGEIVELAGRAAVLLKQLPEDRDSFEGQCAMARLFGAAVRFLVRRNHGAPRAAADFRRDMVERDHVLLDEIVYSKSGLLFWKRLLPDIACASPQQLYKLFPEDDWSYWINHRGVPVMVSKADTLRIILPFESHAVVVLRYRLALNSALPAARLRAYYGDRLVADEIIPQPEDRILRVVCDRPGTGLQLQVLTVAGEPIAIPPRSPRCRVSVLQAIPSRQPFAPSDVLPSVSVVPWTNSKMSNPAMTAISDKKYLFVCGCPRSGTTALGLLLASDPRIAIGIERYGNLFLRQDIVPELFEKSRFANPMQGDTFYSNLLEYHSTYYTGILNRLDSALYIGDKIPWLYKRFDRLAETIPTAKVLMIVRNIFDVAASFEARANNQEDRNWRRDWRTEAAVEQWTESLTALRNAPKRLNLMIVVYEELLLNGRGLEEIFDFLELGAPSPEVYGRFNGMSAAGTRLEKQRSRALTARDLFYISQKAPFDLYRQLTAGRFTP